MLLTKPLCYKLNDPTQVQQRAEEAFLRMQQQQYERKRAGTQVTCMQALKLLALLVQNCRY
jgi:hypothetical protein